MGKPRRLPSGGGQRRGVVLSTAPGQWWWRQHPRNILVSMLTTLQAFSCSALSIYVLDFKQVLAEARTSHDLVFCAHLAWAALRAIWERLSGLRRSARTLPPFAPPFFPPRRPRRTAAGSFRFVIRVKT